MHSLYRVDARAQAIEELYRERIAGYCNALAAITGSYDNARDAVQEAFARALRKRRRLRREESLAPWIWTIAYPPALESQRRRGAIQSEPDERALLEPQRDPELVA